MLTETVSAGCTVARAMLAATAVLLVASTAAQAAGAGDCRRLDAAAVETDLVLDPGDVVLDGSRDKMALTMLFQGSENAARMTTGDWTTVGLTESSLEIRTATRTATWPARGGGYCAQLQSVRVEIGYPELRVYIPAEYQPGTCAYETVHTHEMEHVSLTREVLVRHAPRLDNALEDAAAVINPMWAPTIEAAKGQAAGIINAALAAPLQALRDEHRARNAAIDTADNYHGLQSRCQIW